MPKSNPIDKKDAVRAMDGNLINQNPDSIDTKYIQDSPKIQPNAFKIVKGKGVIFTQSVKNTIKQQFGCRFSDCYKLFIGPIARKAEVQSFLDKSGIEVKLIDIFANLEKGQKIEGLQTRLSILDEEIHTLFNEFIVQAHHYDRTRAYQDFEVEPSPHEPAKPNDDLRFCIENRLYDSAVKRKNLEKERENLQRSLDLHLQEDVELQTKGRLEGTKGSLKEFIFVKASDLEISPPKWIVEDYLEENSLAQIFGDPASGKTFIALDLAASIATGKSWMGKEVKKGVVFYIAGEGHNGLSRRLKAWSEYYELVVEDLYISKQPAQFMDENHARTVSEAIRNLSLAHGKPALIVIDTLARNFGGGDENKTQDMNKFIFSIDVHIRLPFSCCVLIIHHTGHNDKDRARGAMALKGALDAEYCIRKKNELISMTATKMKDSELPPTISFRLSPISIGILDHKGKNIHSAVLEPGSCVNDANLEKVRALIPKTGINQGDLIVKIKGSLADTSNKKAQELLDKGLTTHWYIGKGDNNASIYKPFFGFPSPKDQETEKPKK
ncbi:AAA family ATPase [Parachlamydia acanthamoebae]|uniref:AAA family ATPase n=2 Tax=Parachlamydiaceae TaxID=92713 RepID=UPI00030D9AC2|nr:helicase RepA family protein [Parachlamydia acanthamoebae]